MERRIAKWILWIIFVLISCFCLIQDDTHRVLKVVSSVEFYVDFNHNNVAEQNELVQLSSLNTKPDELTNIECAHLNYLGRNYAKQVLLNKKIRIERTLNKEIKLILPDNTDYAISLVSKGYVLTSDNKDIVLENLKYSKTLDLVSYNERTKKYHSLDCKYALSSPFETILEKRDLPKNAVPCKFCNLTKTIAQKKDEAKKYPRDVFESYSPIYKDSNLEFFITDYTKTYYPSNKCLTTACQSLLKEIKSAQSSIDFAIYGIDNQPEITNALLDAQNRGVKVRWVYDLDKEGNTIYSETFLLKKSLTEAKSDIDYPSSVTVNAQPVKDALMHNKFFIFDDQRVWSGSANISHTDLSGFNANAVLLIDSFEVAKIFKTEFEQMYSGYFHRLKKKTPKNCNKIGDSDVSVFFSPQDSVILNEIVPLINIAQKYVYVPVFVVTHKAFNEALVNAKNRGVDVKLIVDSTSAGTKYSGVKQLRQSGIKVKAENRAGKMHMKSIIIDDEYVVIGSMNFTKSGEKYNDENAIIIRNSKLAIAFKNKFLQFYNDIPDKWLLYNPGAESLNSINSCFDGVDNDFDGKVDRYDEGCFVQK